MDELMTLLVAGHETTAAMLTNTTYPARVRTVTVLYPIPTAVTKPVMSKMPSKVLSKK